MKTYLVITLLILQSNADYARQKVKGVLIPKEINVECYCLSCLTMIDSATKDLKFNHGEAEVSTKTNKNACFNIYHGRFFARYDSHAFWRGCMAILQNWSEEFEDSLLIYVKNLYPYEWIEQDFCVKRTGACAEHKHLILKSREEQLIKTVGDPKPPKNGTQWGTRTNYYINPQHKQKFDL